MWSPFSGDIRIYDCNLSYKINETLLKDKRKYIPEVDCPISLLYIQDNKILIEGRRKGLLIWSTESYECLFKNDSINYMERNSMIRLQRQHSNKVLIIAGYKTYILNIDTLEIEEQKYTIYSPCIIPLSGAEIFLFVEK